MDDCFFNAVSEFLSDLKVSSLQMLRTANCHPQHLYPADSNEVYSVSTVAKPHSRAPVLLSSKHLVHCMACDWVCNGCMSLWHITKQSKTTTSLFDTVCFLRPMPTESLTATAGWYTSSGFRRLRQTYSSFLIAINQSVNF